MKKEMKKEMKNEEELRRIQNSEFRRNEKRMK